MPVEIYLDEDKVGDLGPGAETVILKHVETRVTWSGDTFNNVFIESNLMGRRTFNLTNHGDKGKIPVTEYVNTFDLFKRAGIEPLVLHWLEVRKENRI